MFMRNPPPLHLTNDLSAQYDYCMVFALELDMNKQPTIIPDAAKFIVETMQTSGLETFSYLSVEKDELVVLIRCPVSICGFCVDNYVYVYICVCV